eukprot:TRINITY_DN15814_c0_g1_i6.p1 TRINITY_DN15814_c0_g1~~TRINITY_DN15814_c0_g1_i6.p1  ORF type:complete len:318 (-),score=43.29 TRINITY_DN15814_c0_g1_i6:232-1185(-)
MLRSLVGSEMCIRDRVVPVFEWADVGVIVIAQLVLALHIAQPYCVSIADVAEPGKPRGSETTSITASFPANKITVATVSLMFGCSVITYPFALHQGIIEPGFPYVISDTWWHAPGDIIARWGVTFSTHLLQILLLMLDHATRRRAHNWLWLAQLGTFGMSVVAVVSEVEQPILHVVCALTWGVGVDIYMLASCCAASGLSFCHKLMAPAAMVAAASSALLCIVKLPGLWSGELAGIHGDNCEQMIGKEVCVLVAYYEWIHQACVFLFFLGAFVFDNNGRGQEIALVVARCEPTSVSPSGARKCADLDSSTNAYDQQL